MEDKVDIPSSPSSSQDNTVITNGNGHLSEETSSNGASHDATNIYVANLPPTFAENNLIELFSAYGEIDSVKVMRDYNTGVPRGFAFIKFKESASASLAIEQVNGMQTGGIKPLVVKYADNPSPSAVAGNNSLGTPSNNIYIKNLPINLTEELLQSLFKTFGEIESFKILIDLNTGLPRGQAFVRFVEQSAASAAIEGMNGTLVQGASKPLSIRFADTDQEKKQRKQVNLFKRTMPPKQRFNGYTMSPFGYPPQAFPYAAYPFPPPIGPPPIVPPSPNLFIFHLPPTADESLLYQLFSQYGPIVSAKVSRDKTSGQCKGFGFVTLANVQLAYNAIQGLNGLPVENKRISVSFKK